MKTLEPCKVVVFGGIKEFRLKLKSLGIDKIVNDDESIKESDVVLIVIDKVNGKLVAVRGTDISVFNSLDLKMFTGWEIKDIVYIPTIQTIEDFEYDTNKIYYAKGFDEEDDYWLFKPKEKKQEFLTAHTGCISVCDGKIVFDGWGGGIIMYNKEITELREATPSEVKIYWDALEQWRHRDE